MSWRRKYGWVSVGFYQIGLRLADIGPKQSNNEANLSGSLVVSENRVRQLATDCIGISISLMLALPLSAAEYRSPSVDRSYPDNLYWGDTHVHTYLSGDAFGMGTRVTPDEAYRFAKGEQIRSTGADRRNSVDRWISCSLPITPRIWACWHAWLREMRNCCAAKVDVNGQRGLNLRHLPRR